MSLHPHQHRALVAELRKPEHANRTADQAFARISQKNALHQLGTTRFLTQVKYDSLHPKRRPLVYLIVSAAEVAAFPTGIPGMPNKLRREWFDLAWAEARS